MANEADKLSDLKEGKDSLFTAELTDPVNFILKHLNQYDYDFCPVRDESNEIVGQVSKTDLMAAKDTPETIENIKGARRKWIVFPGDMLVQTVVGWSKTQSGMWSALILKPDDTYDIITYDDIDQWLKKLIKLN